MRVTYGLAEEILASQEEMCCFQSAVTLTPDTSVVTLTPDTSAVTLTPDTHTFSQPDPKALHSVPAAYRQ